MIGLFEQFNRTYAGLHLDPDYAVVGEMLAEKYGIRFRAGNGQAELRFLSRPLGTAGSAVPEKAAETQWAVWPGARKTRRYNASMCIRFSPDREDMIRSLYMKHWVETERGCEPADLLMTDEEFLRGIAILQEYLDRVAVRGRVAECRWRETA